MPSLTLGLFPYCNHNKQYSPQSMRILSTPSPRRRHRRQSMTIVRNLFLVFADKSSQHLRGSIQYSPPRHQYCHYPHQNHHLGAHCIFLSDSDEAVDLRLRKLNLMRLCQSLVRQQDRHSDMPDWVQREQAASVVPVTALRYLLLAALPRVHPDYAEVEVECLTFVVRLMLRLRYIICKD
jgi:hypothetical protein